MQYVGKIYKKGTLTAAQTEVNALGSEWLFDDAAAFAVEDPEHFEFTLRMPRREGLDD